MVPMRVVAGACFGAGFAAGVYSHYQLHECGKDSEVKKLRESGEKSMPLWLKPFAASYIPYYERKDSSFRSSKMDLLYGDLAKRYSAALGDIKRYREPSNEFKRRLENGAKDAVELDQKLRDCREYMFRLDALFGEVTEETTKDPIAIYLRVIRDPFTPAERIDIANKYCTFVKTVYPLRSYLYQNEADKACFVKKHATILQSLYDLHTEKCQESVCVKNEDYRCGECYGCNRVQIEKRNL